MRCWVKCNILPGNWVFDKDKAYINIQQDIITEEDIVNPANDEANTEEPME